MTITAFTGQLDTDIPLAADQLGISVPVAADGDDACTVADAITEQLAEIVADGGDWRHVLAWAYDPRTATDPAEPQAAAVAAFMGCLDAAAEDGELKIRVIRRGVRNFRAEHVDPDNGWASPDQTADQLAAALSVSRGDAQARLDTVAWEHLNRAFWG